MAFVGDNIKQFAAAVAAHGNTSNCILNGNSATAVAFGGATAVLGFGGAAWRRVIMSFPVRGHWTAADLRLTPTATPGANFNIVILPIVNEPDLAVLEANNCADCSFTNVDQSTPTAWNDAGVRTNGAGTDPGHGVDNKFRAVFGITTGMAGGTQQVFSDTAGGGRVNPSSGSLVDVFNRANRAALEAGIANFYVLLVSEDSTGVTATVTLGMKNNGTEANRPSLSGTATPHVVDGDILACAPILNLNTTTTCGVQLRLGNLNFDTGDEIAVEYSDDAADFPDNAAATGGTAIAAVDISAGALKTKVSFTLSTGTQAAATGGIWHYRVRATIQGQTFYSPVWTAPLEVATPGHHALLGDDHHAPSRKKAAGLGGSNQDDAVEAIQVHAASMATIAALCDPDAPTTYPRKIIAIGDNVGFAQEATGSDSSFPILEDGSGLPDSGTGYIATSTDQVSHTFFSYYVNATTPFHLSPLLEVPANHWPTHWHGFAANNTRADNLDISQWALDAAIDFGLIPPAGVTAGYPQPTGREGLGYFAFEAHGKLNMVLNVGIDSEHSGDISAYNTGGDYPTGLEAATDWRVGAGSGVDEVDNEILDWIETTFAGTSATQLRLYMHHPCPGTTPTGAQQGYARSDAGHLDGGFSKTYIHPLILATFGEDNHLVICGHDHVHHYDPTGDDGVKYLFLATPSEYGADLANVGGPYGNGFVFVDAHAEDALTNSNFRFNAGIYTVADTETAFRVTYIATMLVTSPQEWQTPVGEPGATWSGASALGLYPRSLWGLGIADGQTVWSRLFPAPASPSGGPLPPGHPLMRRIMGGRRRAV